MRPLSAIRASCSRTRSTSHSSTVITSPADGASVLIRVRSSARSRVQRSGVRPVQADDPIVVSRRLRSRLAQRAHPLGQACRLEQADAVDLLERIAVGGQEPYAVVVGRQITEACRRSDSCTACRGDVREVDLEHRRSRLEGNPLDDLVQRRSDPLQTMCGQDVGHEVRAGLGLVRPQRDDAPADDHAVLPDGEVPAGAVRVVAVFRPHVRQRHLQQVRAHRVGLDRVADGRRTPRRPPNRDRRWSPAPRSRRSSTACLPLILSSRLSG